MSITIQKDEIKAIITDLKWVCNIESIENILNTFTNKEDKTPDDPYPDLTQAKRIEKLFGWHIIDIEEQKEFDETVVY